MSTLDPRLRMLLELAPADARPDSAEVIDVPLGERVSWATSESGPTVEVLIEQVDSDGLGGTVEGIVSTSPAPSGAVRPVRVPVAALRSLANDPAVLRVEASRALFGELNLSRVETGADAVHTAAQPVTGAGAVVAVIDSGIDYTHPCFRRADGTTRILALWDQSASGGGGAVPFGREYLTAELNQALAAPDPFAVVPHRDPGPLGHGTHVAAIAAGDERGRDEFTGIAPEADLLVVALRSVAGSLGTSTQLVAGLEYVVARAAGRPVVINISQGTNGGGHAGESLVERKIDALAREPGVIVVKSAGNEQEWDIHAGGVLVDRELRRLDLDVVAGDRQDDVIEVWFGGADEIAVAVQPPTGPASPAADPGTLVRFETAEGNLARIDVDEDAAATGDRRATVILQRGLVDQLEPGRWGIMLRAGSVAEGRFDAWIERAPRDVPGAPEQTRFAATSSDRSRTITVPGTARRIITVASHVTKSATLPLGRASTFSSTGPTRLGAPKPDLSAPGEFVVSARAGWTESGQLHRALSGTSMSAPHVAGAVALLLQRRPELTCEQAGQILRRSARSDAHVAAGSPNRWGSGKLDLSAAIELAGSVEFPTLVSAGVRDGRLEVRCAGPARAELRIDRRPVRLAAGRAQRTLISDEIATEHEFDLSDVGPGQRFGEIVLISPQGWRTADDAGGAFHPIDGGMPVSPQEDQDDLQRIAGVGVAEMLRDAGVLTFDQMAGLQAAELARITWRPLDRILREDWLGQAKQLAAGTGGVGRDRYPFTLVALTEPTTGDIVGWEVIDPRTGDQETAVDLASLSAFLTEKAVEGATERAKTIG